MTSKIRVVAFWSFICTVSIHRRIWRWWRGVAAGFSSFIHPDESPGISRLRWKISGIVRWQNQVPRSKSRKWNYSPNFSAQTFPENFIDRHCPRVSSKTMQHVVNIVLLRLEPSFRCLNVRANTLRNLTAEHKQWKKQIPKIKLFAPKLRTFLMECVNSS